MWDSRKVHCCGEYSFRFKDVESKSHRGIESETKRKLLRKFKSSYNINF